MNRERIGSSLDSMFEQLGELEEVRILTQKKILARQLEQARRAGNVSISEMARRMRDAFDLNPGAALSRRRTWPGEIGASRTCAPLTKMPFLLPRSFRMCSGPSRQISAWWREVSFLGSFTWQSSSRPSRIRSSKRRVSVPREVGKTPSCAANHGNRSRRAPDSTTLSPSYGRAPRDHRGFI